MARQPVSWHLRLDRTHFTPPGFKGYTFGNELEWGEEEPENESRLMSSGDATLDVQGTTKVRLPLRVDREKDSVLATLEATVSSPSRRSISNRIATIVHRGEFYLGLKPQTSFLEKGQNLSVDVVAASPEGAPQAGKKALVKLVRREWRSARKAGVGGRFSWITEKEDTEISRQDVLTKAEPASVTFTPDKAGFYFLLASGVDGKGNAVSTTTSFYVTGKDYVPWERRDDDSVELVADAESYRPGGQARVLIKSPYEKAKALVTVERELVLDSRVVEIVGTSSEIAVPIRPEYTPNVFVSVLLVQGRSANAKPGGNQDAGKPSFKIGYVNLNVDPGEKRLAVEVAGDKQEYRPKDPVTLSVKVKDAQRPGPPRLGDPGRRRCGRAQPHRLRNARPVRRVLRRALAFRPDIGVAHPRDRPAQYGEKGDEPGGGGAENAPASPPDWPRSNSAGTSRRPPTGILPSSRMRTATP